MQRTIKLRHVSMVDSLDSVNEFMYVMVTCLTVADCNWFL